MARILIVDDSSFVTIQLSQILTKAGHQVLASLANGDEAISFLESNSEQVDLITLDLTMPGIGGLDALRYIKINWPTIPCLIITGIGKRETVLAVTELGAAGYILKPLDKEKVIKKVEQAL